MSKFTSGPWFITEQDPPEIHGSDERRTVVCITTAPRSNEWNMADARLIAAAPEMYEALLKIVRINAGLEAWHEDAMPDAMNRARSLLARIDGDA